MKHVLVKGAAIAAVMAMTAAQVWADDMQGMNMSGHDMSGMNMQGHDMGATANQAAGVVKGVNASAGQVTIDHGGMTMTFTASRTQLAGIKAGQKVAFAYHSMANGQLMIVRIQPAR